MISQKYGETYPCIFSPRATSDDKINYTYLTDIRDVNKFVHIKRLDGENYCFNK